MGPRQARNTNAWSLDKVGLGVLLYAYAVLLGACYLFAFWRTMGLNVFPYLSLQDFVTAPLNRVSVLMATPIVFTVVMFGAWTSKTRDYKSEIFFYVFALYCIAFFKDIFQSISRYLGSDFHHSTETNVLFYAVIIFCAGVSAAFWAYKSFPSLRVKVVALILVQSAVSMAAGYSDGKAVFNGALEVHFLGNKELCEPGPRDWVYLGSFGGQTFFMNTIDKRLCLTAEKNVKLISRQAKERL